MDARGDSAAPGGNAPRNPSVDGLHLSSSQPLGTHAGWGVPHVAPNPCLQSTSASRIYVSTRVPAVQARVRAKRVLRHAAPTRPGRARRARLDVRGVKPCTTPRVLPRKTHSLGRPLRRVEIRSVRDFPSFPPRLRRRSWRGGRPGAATLHRRPAIPSAPVPPRGGNLPAASPQEEEKLMTRSHGKPCCPLCCCADPAGAPRAAPMF